MSRFEHLKKYSVSHETTAWYEFAHLEGQPALLVAPATSDNRPLLNALARKAPALADDAELPADVRELRALIADAQAFGEHCVVDWRRVVDKDGNDVPFSKEAAIEFLEQLARDVAWMFRPFRTFLLTPYNFFRGRFDGAAAGKSAERG